MDLVRGTALAVYSGPLLGGGGLVTNLCRTLVRPVDCNPIGSSVHGVSQARILEWVPFPSPGDLPDPGIEPRSPTLQADALTSAPPGKPLIE